MHQVTIDEYISKKLNEVKVDLSVCTSLSSTMDYISEQKVGQRTSQLFPAFIFLERSCLRWQTVTSLSVSWLITGGGSSRIQTLCGCGLAVLAEALTTRVWQEPLCSLRTIGVRGGGSNQTLTHPHGTPLHLWSPRLLTFNPSCHCPSQNNKNLFRQTNARETAVLIVLLAVPSVLAY